MIFTIKMGNQSQNHGFVFENEISGKKIELVKRLIGYDLQKLSENFVKL